MADLSGLNISLVSFSLHAIDNIQVELFSLHAVDNIQVELFSLHAVDNNQVKPFSLQAADNYLVYSFSSHSGEYIFVEGILFSRHAAENISGFPRVKFHPLVIRHFSTPITPFLPLFFPILNLFYLFTSHFSFLSSFFSSPFHISTTNDIG
jgi:hypothetical protein